jgi:hypothetical protein
LATAYGFTLPYMLHTHFGHAPDVNVMKMALQILGGFNLVLLALAIFFSFFSPKSKA